jgi:hypothetical protein
LVAMVHGPTVAINPRKKAERAGIPVLADKADKSIIESL